jgi:putative glutamine amidotransferase
MDSILIGGGLPVLATDADYGDACQLAMQADGLFLSGGMDVTPHCYGEEKLSVCGPTDGKRDQIENLLIRAFICEGKPILGICRGFQMLNVFFGGTLYQDISTQAGCEHPYDSIHDVCAVRGSILDKFFGPRFTVNSLHHQAVRTLGKGLVPIAYAENAPFVEAYVHETMPILAMQWHPERMTGIVRMSPDGPDMKPVLQYFISLCRKKM